MSEAPTGLKVFLPRLQDGPDTVGEFRALAAQDAHRQHQVVDEPAQADVILFTECHMFPHDVGLRVVRRHPLYRTRRQDCFLYDERDKPWPVLPGVFVSMPARWFEPAWQRAGGYHTVPDRKNAVTPDLLFSFAGSPTHPIREDLFNLRHERAHVERVTGFVFYDSSSEDFSRRQASYRELLARSKFVLCPRGKGSSSIRLYETLAAGRVPVIVADDWVPPMGPDWSSFSIRWPESKITELPARLEAVEADFERMSHAARAAYEEYFAPNSSFHRIMQDVSYLRSRRAHTTASVRVSRVATFWDASLDHWRWCTRDRASRLRRRLLR